MSTEPLRLEPCRHATEAAATKAMDADGHGIDEDSDRAVLEAGLEDVRSDLRRGRPDDGAVAPQQRAEGVSLLGRQDAALARPADSELSVRRDLLRRRR